jgi:putrescine aminotransferase
LVGALELVKDKKTREMFEPEGDVGKICRDHCFNNGLVMRAVKDTMIVAPPLIMTKEHIDEMVDLAGKCLDLTAKEIGLA